MTQPTPRRLLDLAIQHHRAGQLQQAEQLYRQILLQYPDVLAAKFQATDSHVR